MCTESLFLLQDHQKGLFWEGEDGYFEKGYFEKDKNFEILKG